jgi:hypothetical protein
MGRRPCLLPSNTPRGYYWTERALWDEKSAAQRERFRRPPHSFRFAVGFDQLNVGRLATLGRLPNVKLQIHRLA